MRGKEGGEGKERESGRTRKEREWRGRLPHEEMYAGVRVFAKPYYVIDKESRVDMIDKNGILYVL